MEQHPRQRANVRADNGPGIATIGHPSPSPTETATTAPALRTVPNVLGLVEDEAVARISEVGYRVETTYEGDGVECDRQLVIVLQDPPSGNTVEEGSTVHLTSWCVGDRVAQSISVASRFATAAHTGRLGMLSIDTPVRLYLGGQYITDLQPEKATTWKAWNVCGAESYAGRVCPFNPLQLIKGARDIDGVDQPERITTATPSHSCAHWPGTPAELEAYRTISLEVGEGCTSWGAVTLYLNDVGQIVAVDQILAEP
ncbi:MAG: PASTA domain-containing protein [Nocardioidaceae bacterium]|nr:MAG: PASTA domain-containing protein [Nocardioidaceae bacterium]